ncbi:hypothetical protein BDB00DRAFT_897782 [Zychaea mexicana]|uniref:uncharacterized protein n=1 Tax=Zychaea mexicana TaxID=64656 RepID=UPI0022FEE57C|nr:uncharacterized protein BDB00DRAFT_897782 [Zychaea mexicana]KAI9472908.1 hypothetical protein BDB00DRAFT_897782 [Zychaea mexicana]
MMNLLEEVSEKTYNGRFVDLYVRVSNAVAIGMYRKFGYSVYLVYGTITPEQQMRMLQKKRFCSYNNNEHYNMMMI